LITRASIPSRAMPVKIAASTSSCASPLIVFVSADPNAGPTATTTSGCVPAAAAPTSANDGSGLPICSAIKSCGGFTCGSACISRQRSPLGR
jgi:hypothetical protein